MDIKEELQSHGMKATKQRVTVLSLLKEQVIPITLSQLVSILPIEIDLSTMYRILDLFESKQLIVKTVPIEPANAVYEYYKHGHSHHLICTQCHSITKLHSCPIGDYEKKVEEQYGYIIQRHQLELYGLCMVCQNKKHD